MLRFVADLTQSFFRNQDQTTRRKSKPSIAHQYEKLEARQLLAADCPDVFITFGDNFAFTADGANDPDGIGSGNNTITIPDGEATSGTGFIFVPFGADFDAFQVDLTSSDTSVAQITSGLVVNPDNLNGGTRFNNPADLNGNGVVGDLFDETDEDGNVTMIQEVGDINEVPAVIDDASGVATFQAINVNQQGFPTVSFSAPADGGFDFGGPGVDDDAFLLATFDFDIVGDGTTTFALQVTDDDTFAGPTGFLDTTAPGSAIGAGGERFLLNEDGTFAGPEATSPVFGSAILTVEGGAAIPEPSSAVLLALGLAGFAARRRR